MAPTQQTLANERRCYNVTPSLVGRAHTQNDSLPAQLPSQGLRSLSVKLRCERIRIVQLSLFHVPNETSARCRASRSVKQSTFNSVIGPFRCGCKLKLTVFKVISRVDILGIPCEIALMHLAHSL